MNAKFPATPEEHVFPIVRIAANPSFKPPTAPLLDTEAKSEIRISPTPDNPRRFMVDLRVKVLPDDGQNLPYFIDVACLCFITVDEDVPEEAGSEVAATVGHLIMYPAVRELILSITSRQPWGGFSIGFSVLSPNDSAPPTAPARSAAPPRKSQRSKKASRM